MLRIIVFAVNEIRLIEDLAVLADEGDDGLIVLTEVVVRTAGEQHDRQPILPWNFELPDALIVGLELLVAQ